MLIQSLHKNYSEHYAKFMFEHDIVVSLPLMYEWSLLSFEGKSIYSQMGIRIYIGVTMRGDTNTWGTMSWIDTDTGNICEENIYSHIRSLYGLHLPGLENVHFDVFLEYQPVKFQYLLETVLFLLYFIKIVQDQHVDLSYIHEIRGLEPREFMQHDIIQQVLLLSVKVAESVQLTCDFGPVLASFIAREKPIIVSKLMQNYTLGEPQDVQTVSKQDDLLFDVVFLASHKTDVRLPIREIYAKSTSEIIKSQDMLANEEQILYNDLQGYYLNTQGFVHHTLIKVLAKMYAYVGYDQARELIDVLQMIHAHQFMPRHRRQHLWKLMIYFCQSELYRDGKLAILANDPSYVFGDIAIVSLRDPQTRAELIRICDSIEQDGLGTVLYKSWDFASKKVLGIQIEQRKEFAIKSIFLPQTGYVLQDTAGNKIVGDYVQLLEKRYDILLDLVKNKIYVGGHKATSSDIHSQTMLIEILMTLLEKKGQNVSNRVFSPSSYTKNKNEMTSKVISPFTKFTTKNLGKNISLICQGRLHDFTIKLTFNQVDIGRIYQL